MEDALPTFVLHSETANSASMSDHTIPLGERPDETLMQEYAGGSIGAFNVLFQRYRQPVYGFFRRRLSDPARAEELAQETFLAVVRASARYQPTAAFRTWLYAIAFKILHAHRRRMAFRATFLGTPGELADPAVSSSVEADVILRQAVRRLDPLDREIVLLREFEQLSYSDIATVLSIPLNTVRSRLFRARLSLHSMLSAPHSAQQKESL